MPRILVFQHVPYEPLGTLNPLLRSHGFRIRYVNFGREPQARPSLDGYAGLVVLGGPMNCDQVDAHPHLATEIEVICSAIDLGLPILGICLGSQLVARALGAHVRPNPTKEIGWYDVRATDVARSDPLFGGFEPTERIFQWHGDTFAIPDGAVHLATSDECPNQAFRFGDAVYGLQFHLEVDEPLIERWLGVPAHLEELRDLHGEVDPDQIRLETRGAIRRTRALADQVFTTWIGLFAETRRRSSHPHG